MDKCVRIVCQCDDFTMWEVVIGPMTPFACPNCGRIYTYDGDILEPVPDVPAEQVWCGRDGGSWWLRDDNAPDAAGEDT